MKNLLILSSLLVQLTFGQFGFNASVLVQSSGAIPTDYVAAYPFNGNANDESGNGNNGTVNGAVLTTDRNGLSNRAYSFDGSNDDISTALAFDTYSAISISCWINPVDTNAYRTVWSNQVAGGCDGEGLFYRLASNSMTCRLGGVDEDFTISHNKNAWTHLVVVYTGSDIYIYENNIQVNITTTYTTTLLGDSGFRIGSYNGCTTSQNGVYFNGKIDDIFVYDRALTVVEVSNLFNE